MNEKEITNLQEAESYAASIGLVLTPADREKIAKLQQADQERIRSITAEKPVGMVDQFNAFYPRFLEFLIGVGEVLLTFSQTLIIAFGVPITLVLLLVVEQQRVVHGIALFEVEGALASFAATALVLLNLALEFLIHYIEQQAHYEPDRARRWSLRIWWKNARYTLGIGNDWIAQELSPAQRFRGLLRLVTFTILALALAGSMREVIANTEGAWHEALISIITESNLSLMTTWLGGLLFAAAAVLAAQGLSRYVAVKCAEILARMQSQATPEQQALDTSAVQYIMARAAQYQQRQAAKDSKSVNFTLHQPVSMNGNGNGHYSATE